MAQLLINIGESVNDKRGDPLRTAFDKVNQNFTELFTTDTSTKYHLGDDTQFVDIDPDSGMIVIQSGYDKSMPVYIKGANCSDGGVGGNVVIEAGAPLGIDNFINGTTGNVEIAAHQTTIDSNNNVWTFRDDGALETPGGQIITGNTNDLAIQGQETFSVVLGERAINWQFGNTGRLVVPSIFPVSFTAILDTAHNPDIVLDGDPWSMEVQFNIVDGHIETTVQQIFPRQDNPGYESGNTFYFTGDDHGIGGFGFTITLNDVVLPGPAGWTANIEASSPPPLFPTIQADDTIKLQADATSWTFEPSGKIRLPVGGDIVDSNGDSVLSSGSSIGSFGFVSNLMYCIDGAIIDNSDLTHGATSALILPVNSNESLGSSAQLNNFYGSVEINTGYNNANTWSFGTDGNLTVPGEINSVAGTGDVVIESNNGTSTNTWTFGSDSYFNLPGGTSSIIAEENSVIVQAGNAPGNSNLALGNLGVNLVSEQYIQLMAGGGAKRWKLDTNGTLTLPTTNKITAANISEEGTRITNVENYGTNLGNNTYTWHVADCPVFSSAMDAGLLSPGSKFYPMGQPGQEVFVIGTGGTLEDLNVTFTGTLSGGPFTVESDYYVAEQLANVTIESNGNDWIFGNDGKLSFPDTHLAIENSTIGRKVVTIVDDGIVHTEDVLGSRLVFTDTSTSLETYNNPDGQNNTLMARHYTEGLTAGLEVYAESLSGRTGTTLDVNSGGVTITSSDGVVDNTWNFDIGGDLAVPGIIRRSGCVAELNLGVLNSDNALLKTTDEAGETQLLLSALAGASLTSNHNVLVSAGGTTLTGNIYAEAEQLWEVTRDEDASLIVPATRPWAGMPSYLAYPEIMSYPNPPINLVQVSKTASDAYTAWQEEVAATNVSVSVTGNAWTFGSDGSLELPNGSKLQTYSGGSTGLTSASGGIVEINADGGNETWLFSDTGTLTFPDDTEQSTAYQTTTAPGSSKGVSGNKAGMVAFDNVNFYYCKQDYTDGVADIWVKTAWTSTSW